MAAFMRRSATADGSVIRLHAGGSHPQIEFTTPSGETVSYSQGGFIFSYRVGDRVRVRYDPANPRATASLDTIGALWFPPLLLAALGGVSAAAALLTAFM